MLEPGEKGTKLRKFESEWHIWYRAVIPVHERVVEDIAIDKDIPMIDLGQAGNSETRPLVVEQLMKAFQDYGAFHAINHGVSENLMDEAMEIYKEFFKLPVEEKERFAAKNSERGKLMTSGDKSYFGKQCDEHRYWRDILDLSADGNDEQTWPDNPPKFREVMRKYCEEVRKMSKIILGLMSEGLGVEAGYFDKVLGQRMAVNHYPVCPDPSLTMGIPAHCDPNLLTMIQQDVYGLQLLKGNKWIGVEPLPHAFLVNAGLALTVISNGKIASVGHRVISSPSQPRTSLGTFIYPEDDILPAKTLTAGKPDPPKFKSFKFVSEFMPHYLSIKSVHAEALEAFKIHA